MHSFQPSRGRILFEVFCALAVVASMVGAWQQTQASALLTAAAAAGLYAMVRLFDLGRHEPVRAEEPQRIEFEPEVQHVVPAPPAAVEPLAAVEPMPELETANEEPAPVEPAPRAGAGRRKAGSRKGGGRRASTPKVAEVIEFAPAEAIEPAPLAEVDPPVALEEPEVAEAQVPDGADIEASEFPVEPAPHVPHAPLFEPEPFVRMPRAAFGRRGRI